MCRMLALMFTIAYSLVAAAEIPADDARTAKAILDAAITVHGGPERLAKTDRMTRQAKGIASFGQDLPFADEWVLQLPERWRWTFNIGPSGQQGRLLLVVNGDKGWQSSNGTTAEISKERLEELREEAYVMWLSTLLPFTKENGFTLASVADTEVDGRPAVGVKVTHAGRPEVRLYFDRQSGLLVKIARRAREANLAVEKEYLYRAHKGFEGVQLPTKYAELAAGKKLIEAIEISYQFPRSVDDKTFARP
ncbi:MAG TPA: hypothetical protein VKU02_26885 [Gemmataceae bacterium]|nr:hypothetical protein [Gemmataceae bacterium]